MSAAPDKVSPKQLAKRWSVDVRTVLAWIRSGELMATNVAKSKRGRKRYRIDERDIQEFDRLRVAAIPVARSRRTRSGLPKGLVRLI